MARKTPWHQTLSQLVSEHRAPPGGRPSLSPKPRALAKAGLSLLAIAMVAALSAGVLFFWLSNGAEAQEAPPTVRNATTLFDHPENSASPITTYRARDPENKPVFWTLGGTDAADFTIDNGVLRFNSQKFPDGPDYEVPTDRHDDTNNNGTVDAGEDAAGNNVYKVTVRFSAGGEDGDPTPGDAYDGDDVGELKLTVNVANVNEPGMVTISPRQPQVGTRLTAILTDEDNVAPGVGEWQWARGGTKNGPWTPIPALSDEMTYRPTIDDLNMYLQVTVVYVDRAGPDSREVSGVSEFMVRKDVVTSNQRPKFPDQSTLTGVTSPARGSTDRFISETAAAGTPVGAPVTAFDDATDIEVITYSLRDPAGDGTPTADGPDADDDSDGNPDTPAESDGHAMSFEIDVVTGQITVGAAAMLDADGTDGAGAGATNPYTVVVRAVDGDGETQDITVNVFLMQAAEPPMIDRVYATGRLGTTGYSAGDRAPTEMSHYELDRTNAATVTTIDTNLDTARATALEPATYFATDPDAAATTIKWSLAGPDAGAFIFEPTARRPTTTGAQLQKDLDALRKATGDSVTLAFRSGPDFEKRGDANSDNVYEVTIVASDSDRLTDTLPVTVKVLNSTDDNKPGEVTFSNRQPEVATAFTAEFEDKDGGVTQLKWQWYRAQTTTAITDECAGREPTGAAHRAFLVDPTPATVGGEEVEQITDGGGIVWTKIPGATSATYTPEANDVDDLSDVGRCLRATVTYKDGVDRTNPDADNLGTDVDETLEATFAGSERPVKVIDERNKAPVFKEGDYGSARVTIYRSEVAENGDATEITEVDAAVDVFTFDDGDGDATNDAVEDDTANDLLTYSLSGRDAKSFTIVGTIDNPTPADAADDGTLTFKGDADYEGQREYRVRVTATDPSGDSGFVDVIVTITNINERPKFTMGDDEVVYMENGTAAVDMYKATDPEGSGITYSLVTTAIDAVADTDGSGAVEEVLAAAFADQARFEIGSISGVLSFKASPNFEEARDAGTDNMYQVTVQAKVSDNENPRHFATQEVTVIVTDVNEAPVFTRTRDTLEITENPDALSKEPPLAPGYLYLLNRGVGIPSPANPPAAPNLDVGIPMVAVDDDNTAPLITVPTGISTVRQLRDGLTYELSGADAGYFHIVPATGQILTQKKLDYEALPDNRKYYSVTVKATDPEGLHDSIPLTINVIDIDEVPLGGLLTVAGDASHTFMENDTDTDLGTYSVSGYRGTAPMWTVEGADASHFMIEGGTGGTSGMLKFASSPNFEMPRGMAMSATNTNTYMVTVKVTAGGESKTMPVTVTVTNVEETGMVTLSATGGKVGTPLTAMLSDDDIIEGTPDWQWYRVANGNSIPITGARSASYTPVADDVGNLLKVTATYNDGYDNNNTASASITTPVADANAAPEFATATATREVAENMASGTLVGSPVPATDPNGDVITYGVSGTDAASFDINTATGQIMTSAELNHEAKSSHMITVTATDPDGARGEIAVTVNVTNVDEAGMVILSPARPSVGTQITARVMDPDGSVGGENWQWSRSDTMDRDFTPWDAETTASITPTLADKDRYLRVTVTYNDALGTRTLVKTTEKVVQNADPAFASEATTLSVAENTASGMAIGDPVTATDADGHTLEYTLSGADEMHFDIDMATGQLMTKSALDYETRMSYMVMVKATDPYGAYDSIMVTIMVTDVDETPITPPDPNAALIARYDTNNNGMIEKSEVIAAINDYLFGTGDDRITKAEVIILINRYLFGN